MRVSSSLGAHTKGTWLENLVNNIRNDFNWKKFPSHIWTIEFLSYAKVSITNVHASLLCASITSVIKLVVYRVSLDRSVLVLFH